jgi:para-aminobenzoate synthetase
VKTLIIDNQDSFTYNLYQRLAGVNGEPPEVVRNDADWSRVAGRVFDNIVISPGPGRPERAADFGISARVIAEAAVPLLGVCLGHQGIGHVFGARVVLAPEPVHGRTSRVSHDGSALFAGIPQGAEVVRYHSLMLASELPAHLQAIAWTDDGLIMAIRHRERPLWGVQFHPESIGTAHGTRLLENFRDLTRQHARGLPAAGTAPFAASTALASAGTALSAPGTAPFAAGTAPFAAGTAFASTATAFASASTAFASASTAFASASTALASASTALASTGTTLSAPGTALAKPSATLSAAGAALSAPGTALAKPGTALSAPGMAPVRDAFTLHVERLDVFPDPEQVFVHLFGGKANAFWLDSSMVSAGARFHVMGDAGGPHSEVVRYDVRRRELVITTSTGREIRSESVFSYLSRVLAERAIASDPALPFDFACGFVGYFGYELKAECGGAAAHAADTPDAHFVFADRVLVFDALERVLYLLCLTRPGDAAGARGWFDAIRARLGALPPLPPIRRLPPSELGFRLARDHARYIDDIASCLREIRQGESYEICLTNRLLAEADIQPLDYHRVLRRSNPAPYAAFLSFADFCVVCSSPERFLRIDRERWVESRPIKGTLPRGRTPAEDVALRESLRTSEKNRAENLMIVDLVRNDLGRVCEIGTVHVPGFMEVESYATVHQLVSTIRGRLRADMTAVDCVQAAFPGGSMTGAPKIRTMQIIDALEPGARGVYSGSIGWLSLDGTADLNIVIRTAVFQPRRISIGVGGAIVALSDSEAEFEEIQLKGRALVQAALDMIDGPPRPRT